MTRHHSCRVSPFGHPRIHARLTAPRGISQPPTSFIGSQCQGIHHAPLNTYNTKNHKNEKKSHHNKPHTHPQPRRARRRSTCGLMLATTIHKSNTTPHHQDGATTTTPHREAGTSHPHQGQAPLGLLSQDPTVCLVAPGDIFPRPRSHTCLVCRCTRTRSTTDNGPIQRIAQVTADPHDVGRLESRGAP